MLKEVLLKNILNGLFLASSIWIGLILAKICNDELIKDKKYFALFIILALILIIISLFFNNRILQLSIIYIIIVISILFYKSKIIYK
jgi:hypothetical protein